MGKSHPKHRIRQALKQGTRTRERDIFKHQCEDMRGRKVEEGRGRGLWWKEE